jgi:hypothetical protein
MLVYPSISASRINLNKLVGIWFKACRTIHSIVKALQNLYADSRTRERRKYNLLVRHDINSRRRKTEVQKNY